MNEQIKELKKQAASYFWALDNDAPAEEYEKKFAELIIQKCMAICDEQRAHYFGERMASDDFIDKNMYAEAESACDIIRYKMKKHFGVEE